MTPFDDNHVLLLQKQIASERRQVQILEAELALLRSRQTLSRKRPANQLNNSRMEEKAAGSVHETTPGTKATRNLEPMKLNTVLDKERYDHDMKIKAAAAQEHDLLEILDALQCSSLPARSLSDSSSSAFPSRKSRVLNHMEDNWQDGRQSFLLDPYLTGVEFQKVSEPTAPKIQGEEVLGEAFYRTYEFQGRVLEPIPVLHSVHGYRRLEDENTVTPKHGHILFHILATVGFTDDDDDHQHEIQNTQQQQNGKRKTEGKAQLTRVESAFSFQCVDEDNGNDYSLKHSPLSTAQLFPEEELKNLSILCSNTISLSFLFRELTCFAEFHARRIKAINRFIYDCHASSSSSTSWTRIEVVSASTFRILVGEIRDDKRNKHAEVHVGGSQECDGQMEPCLSLLISWRWIFLLLGRREELSILDINAHTERAENATTEGPNTIQELVRLICDPEGVQSLVSVVGDCEAAIDILLNVIRLPPNT